MGIRKFGARQSGAAGILLVLCALALPGTSAAATVTWTGNAGNGLWFDAGNWSGGSGVPGAADEAVFAAGASGTVSLGGATATLQALRLQDTSALVLTAGSVLATEFSQNGGTSTLQIGLAVTALTMGTTAQLEVNAGASVGAETFSMTGSDFKRLQVRGGATVSAPTLNLRFVRVDVDGAGSALRFTQGEGDLFAEVYLTSGGVLGCIGSSAELVARTASLVDLYLGNAGAPGAIDCATFTFIEGANATARVQLFHNQNGYRLERPDGGALSLQGSMRLTTGNNARSVIPGSHGYSGSTTISNGAALELLGELTQSAVQVNAGSLRGDGRVHGAVSVAANAAIQPGRDGNAQPGTLRVGSLNLVDQSLLQFDLASPGEIGGDNDLLQVDGNAGIDGGRVLIASLGEVGNYRLLDIGGTVTGSLVLQALPAGQDLADWQLRRTGGAIDLVPPGLLEADPATLQLSVAEGSFVQGTVTLRNLGGTDINVSQVFQPEDPRFTRVGGSCGVSGFVIAAGSSCTLLYRFAPTQPGMATSTVNVGSFPQAAGITAFGLQGTASRLPPQLAPALLDFGSVTVDTLSSPLFVALSNPSSLALTVSGIGLDAGTEFDIAQSTCPGSLPAGGNCSIGVVFMPLATGPATDTLRVTTEAGVPSVTVQGSGFAERVFYSGFEILPPP